MVSLGRKTIYGLGISTRVVLFLVGLYLDEYSVGYTDIDYKVFSDGAKYVTQGGSPFERHTYRYTPLLAILMTPNIFFFYNFGKIFFVILDIISGFLIEKLIKDKEQKTKNTMLLIWFF